MSGDLATDLDRVGCFIDETLCHVYLPMWPELVISPTCAFADDSRIDRIYAESTIPIASVMLGQRVLTRNPEYKQGGRITAPCYNGWKIIIVEVRHANGSIVDAQLLRSAEWISRNRLIVGETLDLRLTEIELDAAATVVSISDGPEIPDGDGEVVIGRFVTRQGDDLVRVTFKDGTVLIGTGKHPIWSPTDRNWRSLGEFEPGKFAQARAGLIAIASVERMHARPPVYNIEVDGEHVYEVTGIGVLAHNAGVFDCALIRKRYAELLDRAADAAQGKGPALTPAEAAELEGFKSKLRALDLQKLIGTKPPPELNNAHVHHILFKTGLGPAQQKLVAEGIMILNEVGVDFTNAENLVWASNKAGQHTIENLEKVVQELRALKEAGTSKAKFIEALRALGEEAAER